MPDFSSTVLKHKYLWAEATPVMRKCKSGASDAGPPESDPGNHRIVLEFVLEWVVRQFIGGISVKNSLAVGAPINVLILCVRLARRSRWK